MTPTLTIVTRTFRRPQMLERCVASVWAQECRDFQHVILPDEIGIGIRASYERMAARRADTTGATSTFWMTM